MTQEAWFVAGRTLLLLAFVGTVLILLFAAARGLYWQSPAGRRRLREEKDAALRRAYPWYRGD